MYQEQAAGSLAAHEREYVVQGSLPLTEHSMLRIEDGRDMVIYVWEGEVWITQHRDAADHMVRAGSWFRLDRNGTTVVCAMARSVLTLTAPEPDHYAARVVHLRSGSSEPRVIHGAGRASLAGWVSRVAAARRRWANLFSDHARPTTASL